MNVAALEKVFRLQIDDTAQPHLVSSEAFLEYLNEAQLEACIRGRLLFDRSSHLCNINIKQGVQSYEVDEQIYTITDAFITDESANTSQLIIADRIELDRLFPTWRQDVDRPRYLIQYENTIEIVPKPDANYTLNIEAYLIPCKLSGSSSTPDIHESNHRSLLDWVYYRAYSTEDVDLLDKNKANESLIKFTSTFGNRPSANNLRDVYATRPHRNKACFI